MIVLSTLTYASPAWQHAAPSHLVHLERVQTRAGRIITGHDRYTRNAQILEDLELTTIKDTNRYLHEQFWRKLPRHVNAAIAEIGTAHTHRHTYRTPRP